MIKSHLSSITPVNPFATALATSGITELLGQLDRELIGLAPVKARMVVPVQMVPGLIAALQENFRMYQESFGPLKGPMN